MRAALRAAPLLFPLGALAQPATQPTPPVKAAASPPAPLARVPLFRELTANPQMKEALSAAIKAVGGTPENVFSGSSAARPGENQHDLWHQGATLTPRDSQLTLLGKPVGQLVLYNVFLHSLKDCLAGNYVPIATGPGTSPYAGAGLYDMSAYAKTPDPWIVEVGFELDGLNPDQIHLQVNHEPVPTFRLRETSLLAFVNLSGDKHFVEITQPPADPNRRTRKFWYTRVLKL